MSEWLESNSPYIPPNVNWAMETLTDGIVLKLRRSSFSSLYVYKNTNFLTEQQLKDFKDVLSEGMEHHGRIFGKFVEEFEIEFHHLPLLNAIFKSDRRDAGRYIMLKMVLRDKVPSVRMVEEILEKQIKTENNINERFLLPNPNYDTRSRDGRGQNYDFDMELRNKLIQFRMSSEDTTWGVIVDRPMVFYPNTPYSHIGAVNRCVKNVINLDIDLYDPRLKTMRRSDFNDVLINAKDLLSENFDWLLDRIHNENFVFLDSVLYVSSTPLPLTDEEFEKLNGYNRLGSVIEEEHMRVSQWDAKLELFIQVARTIAFRHGDDTLTVFEILWKSEEDRFRSKSDFNNILKYFNSGAWKLYDSPSIGMRVEGLLIDE